MNENLPNTLHSLLSYLEELKIKLQNGEIKNDEFINKEKMILNKLDKVVQEKDFNGSNLLVSDEKISLTFNKDKSND